MKGKSHIYEIGALYSEKSRSQLEGKDSVTLRGQACAEEDWSLHLNGVTI